MEEILLIAGVIVVVLFILFFVVAYVKAPPDTAYIISGLKKQPRVIIGRATFRIPFLERIDTLTLSLMQVDIKTNTSVPTAEYINIFVDGVANIKISSEMSALKLASENFLRRNKMDIANVAQQVLEGNMREIIGQMKLSDLVQNRDKFAIMVQENAMTDMKKMGLEIVNLTIQNFVDQNRIIEDLGMDNVTQIKKDAAIAKARGERDIQIATSSAKEESNKAAVEASLKISQQNADLVVKQAQLKKMQDIEQAMADAAYSIEKEEQRKTIGIASSNADIAVKEREVVLRGQEIEIEEKLLDAKVRKSADAEKYAKEQQAQAMLFLRQKESEAKKYEIVQEAEALKLKAEASRYAKEQEAIGIEAVGLAEATAIEKKAEAMKKMGEASVLEMYLNTLPEVVKNAAAPLAQTEKIVMYGDGNSTKLIKDVMNSSNQIIDGLKESTGIDLKQIINSFSKAQQD